VGRGLDLELGFKAYGAPGKVASHCDRRWMSMILETEEFEVNDVEGFQLAFESFRTAFEQAGAADPRVFRHAQDPKRVLATLRWPDVETCQKFAREHEAEFESGFGPLIVSMSPSERWEELL
jgi:hypothetical protein